MKYSYHKFKELTVDDIYYILRLRSEVFVIEQNCIYQDIDKKDLEAIHVLIKEEDKLIGYARILKKGTSYEKYSSIGRVVVKKKERYKTIGKKLMQFSVKKCFELYPNDAIKISAQTYLKNFYVAQGFVYKGEDYLEDGIPHCAMYLDKR